MKNRTKTSSVIGPLFIFFTVKCSFTYWVNRNVKKPSETNFIITETCLASLEHSQLEFKRNPEICFRSKHFIANPKDPILMENGAEHIAKRNRLKSGEREGSRGEKDKRNTRSAVQREREWVGGWVGIKQERKAGIDEG